MSYANKKTFKILSIITLVSWVLTQCVPAALAVDGIDPVTGLPQPEIPLEEVQTDVQTDESPSGSLNFEGALSLALEGQTLNENGVTILPDAPKVTAQGSNDDGKPHLPGYVTLKPQDSSHFSYRYDIGAGSGAFLSVDLVNEDNPMDLSDGISLKLKRVNDDINSDGVQTLKFFFEDKDGNFGFREIVLSSDFQLFEDDLIEPNVKSDKIVKLSFVQSWDDLDPDIEQIMMDRRGEVFIELAGLQAALPVAGDTFDADSLDIFPVDYILNSSAFIRGAGSVPGFITVLDENENLEGLQGFRYDVGGSKGSVVQLDVMGDGKDYPVGPELILGMKNSGNGARVLVRVTDKNGAEKEFTLQLTDVLQNFVMDLTQPAGAAFDYDKITKVTVEVDRKLSLQRRGRIDFAIPVLLPFDELQPTVTDASSDASGIAHAIWTAIDEAVVYQVQVATDEGFTDIIHEGFPASAEEIFGLGSEGDYYVRVRASKNALIEVGPLTQWSDPFLFNADFIFNEKSQILSAPTDDQTLLTQINFAAIDLANLYHVQIATDENFNNVVHDGFPSGNFESVNLGENGVYYSRVRGIAEIEDFEFSSEWSDAFSFERDVLSRDLNPDGGLTTADITNLPVGEAGFIDKTTIAPGGAGSSAFPIYDTGGIFEITEVAIVYNTGSGGWAGGGFTFDNFGTGEIETADLSGIENLVFRIKGNAETLKFEILDKDGTSSSVYLHGIQTGVEKFWSIPTALFSNIDLTEVRLIYFIVEGSDLSGSFQVQKVPEPQPIAPSDTLTPADIVDFSGGLITSGDIPVFSATSGGGGDSANIDFAARGGTLNYTVMSPGWAMLGVSFDDTDTEEEETIDLSGFDELTVGLQGDASTVKVIFKDNLGNRSIAYLTGVESDTEQVWSIPTSSLTTIDLSAISEILLVVEGANIDGSISVFVEPEDV